LRIKSNYQFLLFFLVGIFIFYFRIFQGNHRFIFEVLWAEDGLFSLCFLKSSFVSCVAQPHYGYYLIYPKLLSFLVSLFPLVLWPAITFVLTTLIFAMTAFTVYRVIERYFKYRFILWVFMFTYFTLPLYKIETISTVTSIHWNILFAAIIYSIFGDKESRFNNIFVIPLLILTIPTTILIIPIKFLKNYLTTKKLYLSKIYILYVFLFSLQLFSLFNNVDQRESAGGIRLIPLSSIIDFFFSLFSMFLPSISVFLAGNSYMIDGVSFYGHRVNNFIISLYFLSLILILVLLFIKRKVVLFNLLITTFFAFLLFGLMPSILLGLSHRYFLIPLLLLLLINFILLDYLITLRKNMILLVCSVLIFIIYVSIKNLAVANYRVVNDIPWDKQISNLQTNCERDLGVYVTLTFAPGWPTDLMIFEHPNNQFIRCKEFLS